MARTESAGSHYQRWVIGVKQVYFGRRERAVLVLAEAEDAVRGRKH
jgi:hypothetical protein